MSDHPSSDTGSSVDAPVEKRVRKPRVSKTAAATEEAGAQQPNLPLPASPAPETPRAAQAPSRAADPAPAQTSSDGAQAGQAPSAGHGSDTHGEPREGGQSQQQRFNQAQQQQNQNQGQNQGQGQGQQQGQNQNQNQNAGQHQQGQGGQGQGQGQNQQGQNQQGNRRDRFRNRRDRGPRDRFGNDGGMPSSDGSNEPFIARPHPAVPEGFPVYSLSDLKRMPAQKLLDIADQLNIQEGVARARKQDVIFALLKVLTRHGEGVAADGVLEILPTASVSCVRQKPATWPALTIPIFRPARSAASTCVPATTSPAASASRRTANAISRCRSSTPSMASRWKRARTRSCSRT